MDLIPRIFFLVLLGITAFFMYLMHQSVQNNSITNLFDQIKET